MNTQEITLDIKDGFATLSINRPQQKNAINSEMWQSISNYVDIVAENRDIKVLQIKGQPGVFSAGADIHEFKRLSENLSELLKYNQAIQLAQSKLEELERPTIALIDGPCIGGGCGIALSCDFRICSASAIFAITPAKLGLLYSKRDTRRLLSLVGPANAKDILYTGRKLDSDEALAMGLVNKVVSSDALEQSANDMAAALMSSSQYSIRATKRIISTLEGYNILRDEQIQHLFDDAFYREDCIEGVAAFKEKRSPDFSWTQSKPIDTQAIDTQPTDTKTD